MEDDFSTWLTIDEAVEKSGKSRRHVERLLGRQEIRSAKFKRNLDRKAVVVIDPADVPKIAAETLRPVLESAKHAGSLPDVADLLQALQRLLVPPTAKTYLTVREAAQVLGLPLAETRRLVNDGRIPSVRLLNRSRRIARQDLTSWYYDARQVAWQNGGIDRIEAE